MEITESCLSKFDVAKITIRPPYLRKDVIDIELLLLSKKIPGFIRGFVTLSDSGGYNPRSYGNKQAPLTRSAQKRLRAGMSQLSAQLIGEMNDG